MNMNQITKMFTRLVMRRIMNWGINQGMNTISKARKPKAAPPPPQVDNDGNLIEAQQPSDARNRKEARQMAQKVKTMNRMTRR
jgi:hypothetical protein